MKSAKKEITILLCLAMLFSLGGFFICTTSPDNVFIGIAVIGVGMVLDLSAIVPAVKLYKQHNKQKEDRIKKLEDEVELLKKTISTNKH